MRCERGDEVDCWSGLLECTSCKFMLLLYGDCYIDLLYRGDMDYYVSSSDSI